MQLLPTYELTAHSVRADPLPFHEATTWSLPPARIVEFVQPFFFGSRYPSPELLESALYPLSGRSWANSICLGPIAVCLAVVGFVVAPRRAWPWVLIGAAALTLSLGRHLPDYERIATLPFFSTQRYPEKFVFWTTLTACLLAALGAERLLARPPTFDRFPPRRRTFVACLASLAVLACALGLVDLPARLLVWENSTLHSLFWSQRLPGSFTWRQGALLHAAIIGAGLVALVWLLLRWPRGAVVGLLALALGDLVWVHYRDLPGMPATLLEEDPPPRFVGELATGGSESSRVFYDATVPTIDAAMMASPVAERIRAVLPGDWEPHTWIYANLFSRHRLAPNYGSVHGVRYLNDKLIPLRLWTSSAMRRHFEQGDMHTLLAAAAVRYVLTPERPLNPRWSGPGFVPVASAPGVNLRLLEVRDALPEIYLATQVRPPRTLPAGFDDLEWVWRTSGAAIVDAPPSLLATVATGGGGTELRIVSRHPERFVIEVASPHRGALLVVNESGFPGWQARLDGEPVPVFVANYRFMSVFVPPGQHRLELRYRSTYLVAGFYLSVVGVAIGLVWLGVALRGHAPALARPIAHGAET